MSLRDTLDFCFSCVASPRGLLRTVILWKGICCLSLGLVPSAEAFFGNKNAVWREIPPEQFAIAAPLVDPEAGAEYLFREIEVDDEDSADTTVREYRRAKIFNEQGLEAFREIHLQSSWNSKILKLAGRVVLPDGTVRELEGGSIFDRDILKYDGGEVGLKSLALPALEVGAIVELQWEEVMPGYARHIVRILSLPLPVHQMRVRIRPYTGLDAQMLWINCGEVELAREKRFREFDMFNVRARADESYQPPPRTFEPWLALSYDYGLSRKDPDSFWHSIAERVRKDSQRSIDGKNRRVKRATRELVGHLDDPEAILETLYNYVQSTITNIGIDGSGYTPEEIEKLKTPFAIGDVLKNGYGYRHNINNLFASMARAAGLEVYIAHCGDRSTDFFDKNKLYSDLWSLPRVLVAVRVGDDWRYFDPGDRYAPFGTLGWNYTGVAALIGNQKKADFQVTPDNAVGGSRVVRRALLSLSEDGSAEGEVRIDYYGQPARSIRYDHAGDTPQELADAISTEFRKRFPQAVLTEVRLEYLYDLDKPARISYRVSIPQFADATGSRFFVNPSFFQRGEEAVFTEETRELDIYFGYASTTEDQVAIRLPEGYEFESPDAPPSVGHHGALEHSLTIGLLPDGRLGLQRKVAIHHVLLPASIYPPIKAFFDLVHMRDQALVTLRRVPTDTGLTQVTTN